MPELPEAETIVRGLRPRVTGRTVEAFEVIHADVLRDAPEAVEACVVGRRIDAVSRRGKNVVLELSGDRRVVVNLGMTGTLIPRPAGGPAPAPDQAGDDPYEPTHPAVVFHLEDAVRLVFDDTRRFGAVECMDPDAWADFDARLGPEPLSDDFDAAYLADGLARSRSPLRSWLLDQRKVAGVGNIYALEALWEARLHPRLRAKDARLDGALRLREGVRDVLERAVAAGGTTIRDYRNAEGGTGAYVRRLAVYGREGEACPRCGTAVEREVFSNRSAFFCPGCQPAP